MGLNDRDYMKWDYRDRKRKQDSQRGQGNSSGGPFPPAVIVALKMLLTFVGIFVCLRLALPGGLRLLMAFAALMLGAYWIWRGFAGPQS